MFGFIHLYLFNIMWKTISCVSKISIEVSMLTSLPLASLCLSSQIHLCRVPISILPVLTILSLSTQGVPISIAAKRNVPKGPGCCPHNGKNIECATMYTLRTQRPPSCLRSGRSGTRQRRSAQFFFFLNCYRDDSTCSGAILQDCRIVIVKK